MRTERTVLTKFYVPVYAPGDELLGNSKRRQLWLVAAGRYDAIRSAIDNETFIP